MRNPQQIADLKARVEAIESWYHAIDLGDGIRTPGPFHMASFLDDYRLPERLDGLRVLDVGASNGFFSSELERRGAAEVVAIELPSWAAQDWTPRYRADYQAKSQRERELIDEHVMHAGFSLVCEALGCTRIRKEQMTIYELSPDRLGHFDLVFCGSMLMHVRDPVLGIQHMRSVCKPSGRLIVSIATFEPADDQPLAQFAGEWNQCNWWRMSPKCLEQVLRCCDFEIEGPGHVFTLKDVSGVFADPTVVFHAHPRPA